MTLAQIYLDTPEVEDEKPTAKKPRTDSHRRAVSMPKLKNESKLKKGRT